MPTNGMSDIFKASRCIYYAYKWRHKLFSCLFDLSFQNAKRFKVQIEKRVYHVCVLYFRMQKISEMQRQTSVESLTHICKV